MHCLLCPKDIFDSRNFPAEDIFSVLLCQEHNNLPAEEIISRVQQIKSSWKQEQIIEYLMVVALYKYHEYRGEDTELYPDENCSTMMQIYGEIKAYKFLWPLARDLAFMRDILLQRSINGSLDERAARYNEMIFLIDSWGSRYLRRKYYLPPLASALFQKALQPLSIPPLEMLQ